MDLLTLLGKLEVYDRQTINTKNNGNTITYTGTITKVTVNSTDEYTEIIQLFLTHTPAGVVTLHINHHKNNYTSDYKLSEISTLVIT